MNWKLTAQRLKELRNEKGLSHEKLASILTEQYSPITANSLKQYEVAEENHSKKGKVKGMKIEYLYNLASFYDVSSDYILGKADTKSPNLDINEIHKKTNLSEETIKILIENKNKIPYTDWINSSFENISQLDNLITSLINYKNLYTISHYNKTNSKIPPLFSTEKLKTTNSISKFSNYTLSTTETNSINLIVSNEDATSLMKKITEENFGILLQSMLKNELKSINKEEKKNGKHNSTKKQKR